MTELDKMIAEYNKSPFHSQLVIDEVSTNVIPSDILAEDMCVINVDHPFNFDYDVVMVNIKAGKNMYSLLGRVERRAICVYRIRKNGKTR